jgi:hypothetical protein
VNQIINLELLAHPYNWLVVILMLLTGVLAIRLLTQSAAPLLPALPIAA